MAPPDGLDISIDLTGRDPVIVLTGYVDQSTTRKLREALTELIDSNHERLTIDVEGVTFMDSSGIGALATRVQARRPRHGPPPVAHGDA